MDLALHVELVTLDLKDCILCLGQQKTLSGHVLLDFLESDLGVGDVVGLTVVVQIGGLAGQTGLDFVDVQESLPTDLTGVRAQQDVLAGLLLHLISESNGLIEIKVFKKSLSELSEAIGVVFLLSKDQWQCQCLQSISLELRQLDA